MLGCSPYILTRGDSLPEELQSGKGLPKNAAPRKSSEWPTQNAGRRKTRPSYLYTYHIIYIYTSLKFAISSCLESANVCLLGFFSVNPGICVSLKAIPNVFFAFFFGSKSQVMPRHQVAEACETEHSKGGPMRFSSGSLGWKWVIFPHFPPFITNAFCFKKNNNIYQIHYLLCGLNWMSVWILLKSMRVLSFYLTLWPTIPRPRVLPTPTLSTLAAKVTPKCW